MKTRLTHEQRLKIQYFRSLKKSDAYTARVLGCTRRTVRKWANKQFGNTKETKRSGRKTKSSSRKKRVIIHEALNTQTSLRKLSQKHHLSANTVRNIINNFCPEDPIKPYKQKIIPKLTNQQKQLR